MISHLSERALILAPHGRDADVAAQMLAEAGLAGIRCRSIEELVEQIEAGAGFGLVTEEALGTTNLQPLQRWIAAQPEWSDFPFILLTVRGGGLERNPAAARYLFALGNVTFLERPFHPTTLISLAQAARRGRRRQYDARARLEELHALAADLEQRVEERTAEHEAVFKQLHEAQKLETLGQLTGGVAHDFNNLLTPILGALDMLQRRFEGEDQRVQRWIANALQSGERAKTLVQRLLGFARRQELQKTAIDTAAFLEGMRDLVASSIGSTIELSLSCEAGMPQVLADPSQLELALLNLCVNARDAMPRGGTLAITIGQVTVGVADDPRLAPGAYVRLSVRDTGEGMDASTLERAVEPFFSTKEVGRGTGLGLSMVHGLVAQLGGAFLLGSVRGEGTRADIYLPVADGPIETKAASADRAAIEPAHAMTILLVDDEEMVRKGTAEMLRHLGHEVIEAEGGVEALTALATTPVIEAIVTDYKMPRMDGAELARRIQADRPAMPILLISGYTGAVGPVADLPRLNKPFGLVELTAALRRACEAPPLAQHPFM